MNRDNVSMNTRHRQVGIVMVIVIAAMFLTGWFWPRRVELNRDGYDVMIALYRVCNQQSEAGLDAIEAELKTLRQSSETSAASVEVIVDQARAGDWTGAMREAREILDQQADH